jgi:hypothetical protein
LIPSFLDEGDPRPAAEQFDANYQHGGGWRPMEGWTFKDDGSIKYPDDPAHHPVAAIPFRKEVIFIYPDAWVCISQEDGTFEIARMD